MSLFWQFVVTVAGVAFTLAGQHYWHEFNTGADRRKRRRENLEKLATLAFEHLEYLNAELKRVTLNQHHDLHDHLPRIWGWQRLYFPELMIQLKNIHEVNRVHYSELQSIANQRLQNPSKIPDTSEWYKNVYSTALNVYSEFIDECRRLIEEDDAWLANTWRRRIDWLRNDPRRRSKPAE